VAFARPSALLAAALVSTALLAPTGAAAADPVIGAAGDIACDPGDAAFNGGLGDASHCKQGATATLLANAGLDSVLTLGDNQYTSASLSKLRAVFDPTWGAFKSIMHPGIGNHEGSTATGYYDYFNGVGVSAGPAGKRGEGWYSFDIGGWHVVALNSNCASNGACAAGSPQEKWLKADLAAHPVACTLAFWHHARWSSGHDGNNTFMQTIWQDLYDAGADLVLNGHSHDYERFAPQDGAGKVDNNYGIGEIVVGTGGAFFTGISSGVGNSLVRNNRTFGILKLTLHPTSYDWSFIPVPGASFTDVGTGTCHGSPGASPPPPPPPPPPPSSTLTFTPTDDTYAQADTATTNYGTSTQVIADNSPVKQAYWKFTVGGVGTKPVVSAKLRLWCVDPASKGGDFRRVADTSWTESGLNWGNAPAMDATVTSSLGAVAANAWYEVDVTPLIQGDGTLTIGATSTSSDGAHYASKESGATTAPQLVVTTG
jgi:hypothetical protein